MHTSLKVIVSIGLFSCCAKIFCLDLSQEYQLLYNDLVNWNSVGYRSHFDEITYQGSEFISKTQGSLIRSDDQRDIAINGFGYFRLKDENNNEYYSRKAKIIVSENEFGLVPDELMNINETVVINSQQKFIVKHDGLIITNKIEIGKVDVYDFDNNDIDKVIKDRIYIKQGAKVNTVIASDIIQFCLETSNESPRSKLRGIIAIKSSSQILKISYCQNILRA